MCRHICFHLYSTEYFQAMNLLQNEGALLAQLQPLISSSWNNWQARWLKPQKKEEAKEKLLAFLSIGTRSKTASDKPTLSVGLWRAFPQPKKVFFIDGMARILTQSRFDCFLAWMWTKSIGVSPALASNAGTAAMLLFWFKINHCLAKAAGCWQVLQYVQFLRAHPILSFSSLSIPSI